MQSAVMINNEDTLNGHDVVNLRWALGLVHCLQRERGASTVGVVVPSNGLIQRRTKMARTMTDLAMRPLWQLEQECKTLVRIRKVVDTAADNEETKPTFHRILALYNTLIQSVLHLLVLKYTNDPVKNLMKDVKLNSSRAVTNMKRAESHNALADLHRQNRAMLTPPQGKGSNSVTASESMRKSLSVPAFADDVSEPPVSLDQPLEQEDDTDDLIRSFLDDEKNVVASRLLSMLDTFVKLKESIGVERATLSSILLVDKEENRFMLNDLVVEVAAQKRYLKTLSSLASKAGDLQDLVEELVGLSPRMRQLQQKIIERYDVKKLKLDFRSHRELWNILTLYMDKLHALELMIVEEIGFWATNDTFSTDCSTRKTVEGLLGLSSGCSQKELMDCLASRSADSIKNNLMAALMGTTGFSMGILSSEILQIHVTPSPDKRRLGDATAKEWEIGIYEIQFSRRIGEGSAGTTYLASWSGLDVAVKVASINDMGLEGWQTEVQALQRLHHPNIIRLLGCVHRENPSTFCLVLEYCTLGDLQKVLDDETPATFFFTVALDVAKGMSYLHRRGIMHRDIKPSNILLHGTLAPGGFVTKLTDFGMALELSLAGDRTAETGTYRWMAPEVIRHESYGEAADVFSYAVVLWQLVTREEPFAGKSQVEAAAAVALDGKRMVLPISTPLPVAELIRQSWDASPGQRPSFDTIVDTLTSMIESLSTVDKIWLDASRGHPLASNAVKHDDIVERKPPFLANVYQKRNRLRSLFNRKSGYF